MTATITSPAPQAVTTLPERPRRDHLATTVWALMANTGVTSVLGLAFWAGASALYPPDELGAGAALISAMMLLSVVSQLGLATGIERLLPQVRARRWRPVLGAYGATAAAGIVATSGFVLVAPRLSSGFAVLSQGRWPALGLVAAVVLWNIFALQDAVLTSARWAAVVPVENAAFGVVKIGLMVVLAHRLGGHGIFVAWVLAMALLLVPVNSLIFARVLPSDRGPAGPPAASALPLRDRRRVVRYLAVDYTAGLLSQGYTALMPVLVLTVLGSDANAWFYIAFLIAGAVRAVAQSMGTSLVVEGAHRESDVGSMARVSLVRYARYAVPAVAALALAAPLLLRPFGASYAAHGATLLRLLLVATVPHAVIAVYLAVERVRARAGRVVAVEAGIVVLVTAGAVAGMHAYGLIGVGLAWLAVHTVVAALVAPALWRACRRSATL
jgi:O-antigen/teichoic acid export membrane protein